MSTIVERALDALMRDWETGLSAEWREVMPESLRTLTRDLFKKQVDVILNTVMPNAMSIEVAARGLLDDVALRHPDEELKCPYMVNLARAVRGDGLLPITPPEKTISEDDARCAIHHHSKHIDLKFRGLVVTHIMFHADFRVIETSMLSREFLAGETYRIVRNGDVNIQHNRQHEIKSSRVTG